MSKLLKYILTFIWCMALMSCGDDAVTDDNKVSIVFTLSMPGATTTRASGDQDPVEEGSFQENSIDQNRLHVVFYDNNGKFVGAVERLSLVKLSATLYQVVGSMNLKGKQLSANREFSGKVVVFANINDVNEKADYTSDEVSQLYFSYPSGSSYIPMWGCKKLVNVRLEAGKQVDISVVNLLRAMAKISVYLRQDMKDNGYALSQVTLSKYNTRGYCLPELDNYKDLDDADNLVHSKYSHFYDSPSSDELDMTNRTVYVPEFQNIGKGDAAASIHLRLKGPDGIEEAFTLNFVNYLNGAPTTEAFDLVRNHYYQYEVYRGDDGKIRVQLTVRKWWKETHDEILM